MKEETLYRPLYRIDRLRHFYNGEPVLNIDDLSFSKGKIIGLMGPNGSGKSTLLRLLSFVETPGQGVILYKGKPARPFSDAVRSQVTLLPQIPHLLRRTVFKNVAFGLKMQKDLKDWEARVSDALEMVGLSPARFGPRQWGELSGGEAQRAALAARLVLRPEVLLLDEPTASVDAASAHKIKKAALCARREWGTSLFIASHDTAWLQEICDETLQLYNGRIFGTGNATLIFGPWKKRKDGLWEKEISGHGAIPVSGPPSPDAVAVWEPEAITFETPDAGSDPSSPSNGKATIEAEVARLNHERSSGKITITLRIGDTFLTAQAAEPEIRNAGLFPGRKARVCYDPESVRWV